MSMILNGLKYYSETIFIFKTYTDTEPICKSFTMKKNHLFCLLGVIALAFSCKQKIIDLIVVIDIEKNMSISGAGDIKFLSFPSEEIGYAASESNFIYKTIDGGSSWTQVTVGTTNTCNGLEFFDVDEGLCLMGGKLYKTTDGGGSWNLVRSGVKFMRKNSDNVVVIGECSQNLLEVHIWKSTDNGSNFNLLMGTINPPAFGVYCFDIRFVSLQDDQLTVNYDDVDAMYGMNISDGSQFTIVLDDYDNYTLPNDFYLDQSEGVLVGERGMIQSNHSSNWYLRNHYGNAYTYHAVDGYDGLVVCVGERAITTNMAINDNEWNEVFDAGGNGFSETFYEVQFLDESTFYLSGSDGLIYKCRI